MHIHKKLLFILYFFISSSYCFSEGSTFVKIPRITDELVDQHIPIIEKLLKQSDVLRKVIFYGGAASAIVGAAHIFYSWFLERPSLFPPTEFGDYAKRMVESGKSADVVKQVADRIVAYEVDLRNIKAKVQLSWGIREWLKGSLFSKAGSFVKFALNSIATTIVLSKIAKAQRYCKSIFKDRDLKWYIGMHTHMGSFISFDDIDGNPRERFDPGQLFQEFKSMAQLLERDMSSNIYESDKLIHIIQSIATEVMKEVRQVLTYMKYITVHVFDQTELDEAITNKRRGEAFSFYYYLSSCFNECAESIEQLVEKKMNNSLQKGEAINVIQKFINDFNIIVIGFNRIQHDVHAVV